MQQRFPYWLALFLFLGMPNLATADEQIWPEELKLTITPKTDNAGAVILDRSYFSKPNTLVVLAPEKSSSELLNIPSNPLELEKFNKQVEEERPNYKTVIEEIFKATLTNTSSSQIGAVIFISNTKKPVIFNSFKNRQLKNIEETYIADFKSILAEQGGEGVYSDEEIADNAKKFRENFLILRDGQARSWELLPGKGKALANDLPAIFIVQPGGLISHSSLELTPDEIHSKRNDVFSGAVRKAKEIVDSLR
jgi:hypothetical protein